MERNTPAKYYVLKNAIIASILAVKDFLFSDIFIPPFEIYLFSLNKFENFA